MLAMRLELIHSFAAALSGILKDALLLLEIAALLVLRRAALVEETRLCRALFCRGF